MLKLFTRFAVKYMEKAHIDDFCKTSLELFGFSTNLNTKKNLATALTSMSDNVMSSVFFKYVFPLFAQL